MNQFSIIIARLIMIAFWFVSALPAIAGTPTGCTDLDGFPEQQAVDFESEIQPILSNCAGCHGENGSAGLDLRPGEAYENLVGVESTTNPPQPRVAPFDPADSLLLYAVNCSTTGPFVSDAGHRPRAARLDSGLDRTGRAGRSGAAFRSRPESTR